MNLSLIKYPDNIFNSKFIFKKKLNKISLKHHNNSSSFQFKNSDNESNIISFNYSVNTIHNFISSKDNAQINSNRNNKNINIKQLLSTVRMNKSRSDFDIFRNKREKLSQKIFDAKTILGNNSKNEGTQCTKEDFNFNKTRHYLYNNFFNNIIKKHSYSALFAKQKNKSFYSPKKDSFKYSYLGEINKMKKNHTTFYHQFFKKNTVQFKHLKTIFKYLKYPKLKEEEEKKDKNNDNDNKEIKKELNDNLSLNNIKGIYDECLYEIGSIINNINDYFPDISNFYQQIALNIKEKYNSINIIDCLKKFILYCFLESSFTDKNYISLTDIFIDEFLNENSYKNVENFLLELLKNIIKTRENNSYDLINYLESKKNIDEFILSKKFFFPFIFCSNVFNKTQRDIGIRMLMALEIEENLYFNNYVNYYFYFKENNYLAIESKINFINKFLFIVDSGCFTDKNPEVIKKFANEIYFIFRIDSRTRKQLFEDNEKIKNSYPKMKKINQIFLSMINLFGNNFFNTAQIMDLI